MASVFVFVEGGDDERFVKSVLQPLLQQKYSEIKTWQYSDKPKHKIKQFLRTIEQMGADLIFLADLDEATCVTGRKEELTQYHPELDAKKIYIVKPEIEGWYVSGAEPAKLHSLGIDISDGVDVFTKEKFQNCLDGKMVKTEVLIELLNDFSIAQARARSASFAYIVDRAC